MFIRAFVLFRLESGHSLPKIDRVLCTFIKYMISKDSKPPALRKTTVKRTDGMTDEEFARKEEEATQEYRFRQKNRDMVALFRKEHYDIEPHYPLQDCSILDYEICEIVRAIDTHIKTMFHHYYVDRLSLKQSRKRRSTAVEH